MTDAEINLGVKSTERIDFWLCKCNSALENGMLESWLNNLDIPIQEVWPYLKEKEKLELDKLRTNCTQPVGQYIQLKNNQRENMPAQKLNIAFSVAKDKLRILDREVRTALLKHKLLNRVADDPRNAAMGGSSNDNDEDDDEDLTNKIIKIR